MGPESSEYFCPLSLKKRLENDEDFYRRVSGLCALIVMGIPDEIRKTALDSLEELISPQVNVASIRDNNVIDIYLTDMTGAIGQYVITIPSHYNSFADRTGTVYFVSAN